MPKDYGVVIVGGAVMGSATAYFLSEDPDFGEDILVVEPDSSYADTGTVRSGGSVRRQFSTPLNIAVSTFTTEFVAEFHERTQVDGTSPELGFRDTGYLFLATESGMPQLEANYAVQRAADVPVSLLDTARLAQRFPYLNTEDLVGGSLGERYEGTLDPWAFLQGFRRRAQHNGVTYVTDRVTGIRRHSGKVTGVELASGDTLSCRRVVNCAGVRGSSVASMIGLDLPVEPRSRTSFVFACQTAIDGPFPLHIDTSGVHVRRDGPYFLSGTTPDNDVAVDPTDLDARTAEFEDKIWPALAHRIPQFEAILLKASWGGHYAYNTFDQNMIVGPAPGCDGFYFANGFSGHGLQQAPAVGRAISEHIVHGAYQTLDLTPLAYDRIISNAPIREKNII